MKISEVSFRSLFHNIVFILFDEQFRKQAQDFGFPWEKDVNGACCYGYIDYQAGFSFEMLCLGKQDKETGRIWLLPGKEDVTFKFRWEAVQDMQVLRGKNVSLYKLYADKIKMVDEGYEAAEPVRRLRDMKELDSSRYPANPDDVKVYLISKDKDQKNIEIVWVRLQGADKTTIFGTLLNEPGQDFGVHKGDTLHFQLLEKEKEIACVALL